MKTMKLFALLLLTSTANAATWYVSPTGNDGNPGTLAEPFRTIQEGHDVAVAGDTIYVRGGTYESSTEVTITRDGVSGNPISLLAYPNERPIIDGINLTNDGTLDILRGKPLRLLGASWWVIDGFEIKRGSSGGIIISQASNNNIIRRLDVHHNGRLATHSGTGVMLHDRSENNLIEPVEIIVERVSRRGRPPETTFVANVSAAAERLDDFTRSLPRGQVVLVGDDARREHLPSWIEHWQETRTHA